MAVISGPVRERSCDWQTVLSHASLWCKVSRLAESVQLFVDTIYRCFLLGGFQALTQVMCKFPQSSQVKLKRLKTGNSHLLLHSFQFLVYDNHPAV